MFPDDMRLLRLENAEYLIPSADAAYIDRLLERRKPRVDYAISPLPPPRDPFAAERKADLETAAARMPYDDGDALREGHYVVDPAGGLKRTGPAQVRVAWHGTTAPMDTALALEPRAPMVDGREHLREVPAVYSSPDALIAHDIAFDRWRKERDAGKGNEQRPQMYEVAVTPSETVELGDCTDAPSVEDAITSGADVIECPDWVNQDGKATPEMIVLNDDVQHTVRALQVNEIPERDVSETLEQTEQTLRADRRVGRSISRPRGMPRHTTYKGLPVKPRKPRARKPKPHPYLRKGR